jgi:oligoribonuclease
MVKHANILWVDLEMTGLDPNKDRIVEIGAIVTDWDFKEIATYESAVSVSPSLLKRRMKVSKDFWDKNTASRDGLIEQNKTAPSSLIVENELLAFIDKHFKPGEPVLLAGNSIHQDRRFIVNEWPRLDQKLHYRMLDVTAWKVVFEAKFKKKFAKPEEHRAISDIRGSIEELQYYLKKVNA